MVAQIATGEVVYTGVFQAIPLIVRQEGFIALFRSFSVPASFVVVIPHEQIYEIVVARPAIAG